MPSNQLITAKFWTDKQNQRNFVVNLAKQAGFDPLIAENWYLWNPLMTKKLVHINVIFFVLIFYKHISPIMKYYSGNRTKAIHHLFPDIGLKQNLFSLLSTVSFLLLLSSSFSFHIISLNNLGKVLSKGDIRQLLTEYAISKEIDLLHVDSWDKVNSVFKESNTVYFNIFVVI